MTNNKIDIVKLNQLIKSGKSVKECAKYFGVTPSAISQAKKGLNVAVVKNVALENAHRVVDKNLNAVEQLQKINGYANDLLDLLMRWNNGDDEALQILETQVATKKIRVGDQEEYIREFKFKDPRELALKAMAEIRGQLKLQLEMFQALYDLKAVEEFQNEVLTAIGEENKDVRDRIVQRLCERRAVRAAVKFT
jgi:predicted transcriptional regulator